MSLLRRLLAAFWARDGSTVVNSVCYDPCNNAYVQAQAIGKVPALCDVKGSFVTSYQACTACVNGTGNANATQDARVYLETKFSTFLDYCLVKVQMIADNQTASYRATPAGASSRESTARLTLSEPASRTLTIPESWLTLVTITLTAKVEAIDGQSVTATITQSLNITRPDWTGFSTTPTPPPQPSTFPPVNRDWIAGPVVGGVVAVVLLWLVGVFFYRRRRRGPGAGAGNGPPELAGEGIAKTKDEPELHSDPAVYHEMDAREQHEMQGNDVMPQELPGSRPGDDTMPAWEGTREGLRPV